MNELTYQRFDTLISRIDEPNRGCYLAFLQDNKERIQQAPGARKNHQTWTGGYLDHTAETMNIATILYPVLATRRPLLFSLSDALLVMGLHDIEKPWRYQEAGTTWIEVPELNTQEKRHLFVEAKIKEYGFVLTDALRNALRYVEGEGADYKPGQRTQGPLAAFCHACDTFSARIWYDHPLEFNDPWPGATTHRPSR